MKKTTCACRSLQSHRPQEFRASTVSKVLELLTDMNDVFQFYALGRAYLGLNQKTTFNFLLKKVYLNGRVILILNIL